MQVFLNSKKNILVEDQFAYPISVNGKTKFNLEISLALNKEEIEKEVLNADEVQKLLAGQSPKKVVVVPGRIVNIVILDLNSAIRARISYSGILKKLYNLLSL